MNTKIINCCKIPNQIKEIKNFECAKEFYLKQIHELEIKKKKFQEKYKKAEKDLKEYKLNISLYFPAKFMQLKMNNYLLS